MELMDIVFVVFDHFTALDVSEAAVAEEEPHARATAHV